MRYELFRGSLLVAGSPRQIRHVDTLSVYSRPLTHATRRLYRGLAPEIDIAGVSHRVYIIQVRHEVTHNGDT